MISSFILHPGVESIQPCPTVIHISAGEYRAEIILEALPQLPVRNIRKLLRLMFSHDYENSEADQTITKWLPEAVKQKKDEWYTNRQFYFSGYRKVKKGSRKKADMEQRAKNRVLTDGVKDSKADYYAVVKLQSIFQEIKNKEKKNYA